MATLKDVAAETGLTVTTVSRVLNNRGYISEETRQKVYDAMKKLNYHPNEVARSLSKQTNNTIGVIVPHINHPYFSELISNIESVARHKGYKIILCNSKAKDARTKEYLEMCTSNRVAGILLCSGRVSIDEFKGTNIPIITIERFLETGDATVECDNVQGGKLATELLIKKGCRHLLHISGVNENAMPADTRARAFIDECERYGVEHREIATNIKHYYNLEYHEFLEEAMSNYPEVDGVFASSDLIAAQVLQVCAKKGLKVPDDVKVVGFDDVYMSSLTTPRITTIHQPIREMAEMAIDILIHKNEGKAVPVRTMLPVTLIEREST